MEIMIRDLLSYCRALNGSAKAAQAVESDAVLETALGNLQRMIEETGAEITWDELPAVFVQEIHLLQIFQNLVSNALKYCGDERPRVHISATQDEGQWVFSVADNGIGISSQFQERIFGVFKRLGHRDVPGSGIGLALCKRIVEHYGGRIWVDSEVNRGATFFFTVPLEGNKAHEFQYA
jgi:signal transduction histidine kinase